MDAPPLIATKFYIPSARADVIQRARLTVLLDASARQPLTLISAPPGFGKTMLVADWVHAEHDSQIAWLALDESDDQPALFWLYFITALQQRLPNIGETAKAMLIAPTPPALETILTALINELAEHEQSIVLVIDDYHFVQSPEIHNNLNFFLDHQPAHFHLILLTREDPPLALARRRARRQVIEIRAANLRFTVDETASFLNTTMGLTLTVDQIAALERRTEGWIVGLQMAALSMRGQDVQVFLDSFTGDDRYIADYLIEEVLNRQPEAVRNFLVRTSILDKLSAPLCAVVLNQATAIDLTNIERSNLFLIPLDHTRAWYRYHHLFAELLRQSLRQMVSNGEIADMYRAASAWCEENNDIHAAIRYARQIPDEVRATEILQRHLGLFFYRGELPQLTDFARNIPGSLRHQYPLLCCAVAWAMIATRQPSEPWLESIEKHYGLSAEAALTDDTLDNNHRAALLEVLIVRQQPEFDNPAVQAHERLLSIQSCLSQLPDEQPCLLNTVGSLRPVLIYNLGFDAELRGDVQRAAQYFEETIVLSRSNNNQTLLQVGTSHLAHVQLAQGQLHAASRTHELAIEEASQTPMPTVALAHAGLGSIHYEWGNLDRADSHFQAAFPLAQAWNQWEVLFAITVGLARISKRRGAFQTALTILDDFQPQIDNLLTLTQAIRLSWMGDSASSASWLASHHLSASTTPTLFNETLLLEVTRIFIAMNRLDDALILAKNTHDSAKEGGWKHYVIEGNILLAKILSMQGKEREALDALADAVQLAAPENYLSIFVDEGIVLSDLLHVVKDKVSPELRGYVEKVLAGFAEGENQTVKREAGFRSELSEREREVLLLVAEGLSNQEIAARLVISITTVKTHVGNIFNKFGVTSRTQALARAAELGLLPRT